MPEKHQEGREVRIRTGPDGWTVDVRSPSEGIKGTHLFEDLLGGFGRMMVFVFNFLSRGKTERNDQDQGN